MRYDPDDRQFIFNTEKHMDVSGVSALLSEKKQRLREEQRNHPEKKGTPIWASVLVVIGFIGLIVGVAVAAQSGHPSAAICMFGGMFVFMGFVMIPKTRAIRERSFAAHIVIGVMAILLGLSVSVPMLLTDKLGSDRAFAMLGAGMFASGGLLFLVYSLFRIYSTSNRNGIPVEGRCIGYAHMIVNQRNGPHVESSEVFEYDYAGEHYESVNEAFRSEPDAEIGETVTMRLNPRIPSEVFYSAPRKGRNTGNFVRAAFSALFVVFGTVLGVLALNGRIGSGVPGQNTNADGKYVFTDEAIEEKIGDHETPWEISLINVAEKYEEDGVYYLRFSSDIPQSTDKDKWDQFEVNDAYYIVRNTATGKLIAVLNEKEWDYQGSHPLSDLREP